MRTVPFLPVCPAGRVTPLTTAACPRPPTPPPPAPASPSPLSDLAPRPRDHLPLQRRLTRRGQRPGAKDTQPSSAMGTGESSRETPGARQRGRGRGLGRSLRRGLEWTWGCGLERGGVEGAAGRRQGLGDGRPVGQTPRAPDSELGSAALDLLRRPLGLLCGSRCCAGGSAVSSSGAVPDSGEGTARRTL